MEWASSDLVRVISYLLPGFLAAWLFYGLTAHPKTSPFERVVQALIFTAIIQMLLPVTRWCLEWAGTKSGLDFGPWTRTAGQVWSLLIAFAIGLVFALFANKDWFHRFLRWIQLTKRTSYPGEWFNAFNIDDRYVILHLTGKRRIQGWPNLWPDHPDSGHFMLNQAVWLLDDNECATLHTVERILIPAKEVEMVEFLKNWEEVEASSKEIEAVERKLVNLNKEKKDKENNDGKQSTATPSAPKAANARAESREERLSSYKSDGSS